MRENVFAKREFATLAEGLQPAYLIRVGGALTTNAGTFPVITFTGAQVTTHAITLLTLFGLKDNSTDAQDAYDAEKAICLPMMEEIYDGIDFTAQGDAIIVAKGGVNPTSVNTARIGIADAPANLHFESAPGAGDVFLLRDTDKLALGSVIVTFADITVRVIKSANTQLKITVPPNAKDVDVFVDVVTVIKALIQTQVKLTEINAVVANYNTNGLSPVASPQPVVIGK